MVDFQRPIILIFTHSAQIVGDYKFKFCSRNGQTLLETCTVALQYTLIQIKLGFVQVKPKSAQKLSDMSDYYPMK